MSLIDGSIHLESSFPVYHWRAYPLVLDGETTTPVVMPARVRTIATTAAMIFLRFDHSFGLVKWILLSSGAPAWCSSLVCDGFCVNDEDYSGGLALAGLCTEGELEL